MGALTATYANTILDYLRGAGAPSALSGIFLDLYNGDPQGSGTSVLSAITGSAVRSNLNSALSAAAGGATSNPNQIIVTSNAVGSATVTHVAFFNAATGGALVSSNALTASKAVIATNQVVFLAANLQLSLS